MFHFGRITLSRRALVGPLGFVACAVAMLHGCSKTDDDYGAAPSNAALQAQAAQASLAAAREANAHHGLGQTHDDSVAVPSTPMPTRVGAAKGEEPIGMARMLGQPTLASTTGGALPPAIGAPHIYHLGANGFFLDQASAVALSSEQQARLTAIKESATTAYATTRRKIEQAEQDLWVLSSSDAPDIAQIETKIGEIARLTGQQRIEFIRSVGVAVGALSDAQRKAVTSQAAPTQAGTMPPAGSASGMSSSKSAASSKGMGMGRPSKMAAPMPPTAMPPDNAMPSAAQGMGTGGAAAPSGMGHM